MGGFAEVDKSIDPGLCVKSLCHSIESGLNRIDTAEEYAKGFSEQIVGRALDLLNNRESIFLTTKVSKENLEPKKLNQSLEASLKRLHTDYIDLYLIHKPNDEIPLEQTLESMKVLIERGKTRYVGVSNFSRERMLESKKYLPEIMVNQVQYSLKIREAEKSELIQACKENSVILEAWRPLEKGSLFDTIEANEFIQPFCQKYQRTPQQIAINWILSQGFWTLSTMRSDKHLKENIGSMGWEMESSDIEKIRDYFPGQVFESRIPLI